MKLLAEGFSEFYNCVITITLIFVLRYQLVCCAEVIYVSYSERCQGRYLVILKLKALGLQSGHPEICMVATSWGQGCPLAVGWFTPRRLPSPQEPL